MIVPFAPGGGTDVIARYLATGLSDSMNRPVVVDNRAGANGIIGTEIVARAPGDGYTLIFVSSPHSVNPSLYPKLPYDTLRDFAPVSLVATAPYVLVIHPSVPARNVKELIALAKARPDQVTYASGGSGSSAQLAAELFKQMAGVKLREIPYKGAGPALLAVVSGESAVVFGNALTVKPHIESGRLRALGIASPKRSPSAPELPTIAEAGVPGYSADAVLGILVPAKTPRDIIDRLNRETHKVMGLPGAGGRNAQRGRGYRAQHAGGIRKADRIRNAALGQARADAEDKSGVNETALPLTLPSPRFGARGRAYEASVQGLA
jgi:tripartite-type tricarboxylate transporter receptor subunit TctC